jgi:hypothetical protein
MNPGDLYFDRSHEDSGYTAAAFLLRMFQLDSALQHIKNYHHRLLSECVFDRGMHLYLCTAWLRSHHTIAYSSHVFAHVLCTKVHRETRRRCVTTLSVSVLHVCAMVHYTQHMYCVTRYTVKLEGGVLQHCQYPYCMSSAMVHYTQHMTCTWQPRYGYRDLSNILYIPLTIRYLFKRHRSAIRTNITLKCLKSF